MSNEAKVLRVLFKSVVPLSVSSIRYKAKDVLGKELNEDSIRTSLLSLADKGKVKTTLSARTIYYYIPLKDQFKLKLLDELISKLLSDPGIDETLIKRIIIIVKQVFREV